MKVRGPRMGLSFFSMMAGSLLVLGGCALGISGSGATRGTAPLEITSPTFMVLPDGKVGEGYSQILAASGGTSGYRWSLNPGSSSWPVGLSLNSTGVISGTPTTAGSSTMTVQVVDSVGGTAIKQLSLIIHSAGEVPVVHTGPLLLPAGMGGTLMVRNAAASVDGAFTPDRYGTSPIKGQRSMILMETGGNHMETVVVTIDMAGGAVGALFGFYDRGPGETWVCGSGQSQACHGLTVNGKTGTVTFVNTALEAIIGESPSITLNGTVTSQPF